MKIQGGKGDQMKVCLVDAGIFIDDEKLLEPLHEIGDVSIYDGIPESVDELVSRAYDAEAIAFGLMQFTNEMLDRLPNLKVLQFIGTGVWNFVDVDYANEKGIKVLNIDGYGSNAVAEFAVSLAFTLAKRIVPAGRVLKNNDWTIEGLKGIEISGCTFGVAGTGSIGSLVAKKARYLGANVIATDVYENQDLKDNHGVEYVEFDELFKRSDIVTLHMKVTNENEKIINRKFFSKMKENAIFVNVARAELVDNGDLYEALTDGNLGFAAMDVYESEPPSESDYRLAKLDNVVATPHIAYYTQEANDNSIRMTVESILEALKENLLI